MAGNSLASFVIPAELCGHARWAWVAAELKQELGKVIQGQLILADEDDGFVWKDREPGRDAGEDDADPAKTREDAEEEQPSGRSPKATSWGCRAEDWGPPHRTTLLSF